MDISILVLTFNHGKYIKKALDSILGQKINASYEIIILDDASTDNTQKILLQYKKRYPDTITLYLRKTNSGHPTKNGYFLVSKAKGRYYAILEGDDYWTDNLKIQKQYEFMETHKKYSACMTDLIVVDEKNDKIELQVYDKKNDHIYTIQDFYHLKMPGMLNSLFARNYFNKDEYSIIYTADKIMGDITFFMLLILKGSIYQLDEKMAAYRYVSVNGENNFNSIHKNDIYKEYRILKYWIKLENHLKQYQEEGGLIPIKDAIIRLAFQYSEKAMLNAIWKSQTKLRYLLVYLTAKYLLDGSFGLKEEGKKNLNANPRWKKFINKNDPIVLFGAGAAAEEYIDRYAWKDNIIFLIDNDANKKNKSFKGYLVKSPDELVKYKDTVNVLITNSRHEDSIIHQLENMGIHQYACYCSMQADRLRHRVADWILKKL